MDDQDILQRIQSLIDEEHDLRQSDSPDHAARLQSVEVALDQCWDLLRQRRAKRHAHLDPDEAVERDPRTVEGYQQ